MDVSKIGTTQTPNPVPRGAPAENAGRAAARSEPQPQAGEAAAEKVTGKPPFRPEDLKQAVDAMNDFVAPMNNSISFTIDKETGQTVVKVIDRTTDEVVRQIPSEEALEIARALDKFRGLLIQDKA